MKFFKEIENEVALLSRKALTKLYDNISVNSRGSKTGSLKTALKENGASPEEIKKLTRPKTIDSRDKMIQHLQEVWVNQKGRCYYSGVKLDESLLFQGDQNIESISVDRIKNEQGYVVGNIRLTLRGINKFRSVSTDLQFEEVLKKVALSVVDKYNL